MTRWLLALGLAVAVAPAAAAAYPQFQLTTGAVRCNQCHFAPAGGGLINNYGREEAGDTISRGGDGAFLHGAWDPPDWLLLGGDARLAMLAHAIDQPESPEFAVFGMQLDAYVGLRLPLDLTAVATAGLNGAARRTLDRNAASYFQSREHYLLWRRKQQGAYVRGGRFMVPYGLRLVEHPLHVRRRLASHTLDENYGLGGGWVFDSWELHLTGFVPAPMWSATTWGPGAAVMYERRFGEATAAGVQARAGFGDASDRYSAGLFAKRWFETAKLLALAQVDGVIEAPAGDLDTVTQVVAFAGLTWMPVRGLMATLFVEQFDQDLATPDVARNGAGGQVQWFPWAHVEVSLFGRLQSVNGDTGVDVSTLLLQLHYYL